MTSKTLLSILSFSIFWKGNTVGTEDQFDAGEIFAITLLIVILLTLLYCLFAHLAYCACWIIIFHYRKYRERKQQQNDIERGLRRPQTTPPPPQILKSESPQEEVRFRVKIKVVTYDREKMQNKSDSCCAICLADFGDGDNCAVVERCQHMFHRECIEPWLKQWNLHCPCCRGSIPLERRLIPISDQSS